MSNPVTRLKHPHCGGAVPNAAGTDEVWYKVLQNRTLWLATMVVPNLGLYLPVLQAFTGFAKAGLLTPGCRTQHRVPRPS